MVEHSRLPYYGRWLVAGVGLPAVLGNGLPDAAGRASPKRAGPEHAQACRARA
ncbi:MAG TPA: hypothetical protein VEM76_08660 [Anaeromyxobacteraceae bacterium]|nr:hypothetical protein [Anaeromyxobacteraceae bacterium]